MRIWRIIAHDKDPDGAIAWSKKTGRIAVGWGKTGDLRERDNATYEAIRDRVKANYSVHEKRRHGGPSLWNFWNMKIGDFVIVGRGGGRRSHVVRIVGNYQWVRKSPLPGEYMHQRAAVVTDDDADELWSSVKSPLPKGQNKRWTVVRCNYRTK